MWKDLQRYRSRSMDSGRGDDWGNILVCWSIYDYPPKKTEEKAWAQLELIKSMVGVNLPLFLSAFAVIQTTFDGPFSRNSPV